MTFTQYETRAMIRLTLPILATQLAQVGMGTIDTIMSGYVSTRDLAAIAIGTSLWLPAWLFLAGILVALSPLASRLNGAGSQAGLPRLLAAAVWSGLVAGILCGAFLLLASSLLDWLVDDPVTARIAADYLLAIALGFPAVGVFLAFRFYAEALDSAAHVTRIMLSGLLLNIPANAVFVYGWFGLPALGGVGCGIGSSLIFTGMAIAMALNTRKHRIAADFPLWSSILKPHFDDVRRIFRIGIPIGLAIFFEVSLFTVIALFLTELGPTVVAGHQVALNVSSITFMIPLSLGMALTVRVGHYLGKGDLPLARRVAWLGVRINLLVALFNATFFILASSLIAGFYSPDPAVVAVGASLLLYAAVFQLSDATQVAAAGALRGYQDTLAVMLITFVSYWGIGLSGGHWLAFEGLPWWDINPMGAEGFWIGLIVGLSLAAVGLGWRLKQISRQHVSAS